MARQRENRPDTSGRSHGESLDEPLARFPPFRLLHQKLFVVEDNSEGRTESVSVVFRERVGIQQWYMRLGSACFFFVA